MLLEPLVSIILLLFILFLIAALIIWHLFGLREMGLRDKERSRTLQAVASRAASTGEYDAVVGQDLDTALNTGLTLGATDGEDTQNSTRNRSNKSSKKSKRQSKKQTANVATNKRTAKASNSSSFKTTSFGSNSTQADAFDQFAQDGLGGARGVESGEFGTQSSKRAQSPNRAEIEHEAALLKPPKPEDDIFSTSERRDDIWLFHTAEVDPIHPAEDMTKFRQPGGITGESSRNTKTVKQVPVETSVKSIQPDPKATTEITPPIQPENKLRATFGRDSRDTLADEKVVRMTNSSSRVAAERLIVDKELRQSQVEVHQANNTLAQDTRLNMPVQKPVQKSSTQTPKSPQPSKAFKGSVPPIPKDMQKKLKQTLDEVTDNVSNTSKDDWKNYKNLKNTRSLISTNVEDE